MRGRMTRGGLGLLLMALFCGQCAWAAEGGLTPRRTWGLALFGGSAVLLKKGWDFHRQADDFYDLYRRAGSARDAEDLYDRADNRDVKSQMSFLAAGAFALAGWQLWSGGGEGGRAARGKPQVVERALGPWVRGVRIEPRVEWERGRVGLNFKREFF